MFKLQVWTTDVNGDPDELVGEIEASEEDWMNAQGDGATALEMIRDLAMEVNGGC